MCWRQVPTSAMELSSIQWRSSMTTTCPRSSAASTRMWAIELEELLTASLGIERPDHLGLRKREVQQRVEERAELDQLGEVRLAGTPAPPRCGAPSASSGRDLEDRVQHVDPRRERRRLQVLEAGGARDPGSRRHSRAAPPREDASCRRRPRLRRAMCAPRRAAPPPSRCRITSSSARRPNRRPRRGPAPAPPRI